MKKAHLLSIASLMMMILLSAVVFASQTRAAGGEHIDSFAVDVSVNTDNSIDVEETIMYNTGGTYRHGIYRDIRPYSSQNRHMLIQNIRVTDEKYIQHPFETSYVGGNLRLKIGDPDTTFTGEKTYVIRYHATRAVAHFAENDEIYWNALGNAWTMPIDVALVSVHLPNAVQATQSSCYVGLYGSADTLPITQDTHMYVCGTYQIAEGEDLTIAVGFPKGVVNDYSATEEFFATYLPWMIGVGVPLVVGILCFWYWYKKGRDPKGRGVIIPQYDVPDNLSPWEVDGIVNQKVQSKNISAEIVYLATQGFLRIEEIEKTGMLSALQKTDYRFVRIGQTLPQTRISRQLLNELFPEGRTEIVLSSLKNHFYKQTKIIIKTVLNALVQKKYYSNLGAMKPAAAIFPLFILVFFWTAPALFSNNSFGIFFTPYDWVIMGIGFTLSIVMVIVCTRLSPAKTPKGVETKEYLLGLKEYLQIAEKDRLQFHNAPDKKPEVFEKLLPYAMVLGVTSIWAKEFVDVYTTPPSWYVGTHGSTFNAVIFSHSLTSFSAYAGTSMTSAPGSAGGGFSGGGGGGGGGGGW
ncbi:MAG: DUF2207 domain-containing protein [Candidatus Kerfeldbacteria bacterium]|nr:DUF2207 domain-containing protein [Candidatus Kerfeldbacteria bacterium]